MEISTAMLESKRLILRRFKISDAEDMFNSWAKSEKATKYLTWKPYTDANETKKTIERWLAQPEEKGNTWAIVYKDNGANRLVGSISTMNIFLNIKQLEVGYVISPDYWGKGLMTEALSLVISHIFDTSDFNRIEAICDINNIGSRRVMEKAGMIKEGLLRQASFSNQGIVDVYLYSALRQDYLAKNS